MTLTAQGYAGTVDEVAAASMDAKTPLGITQGLNVTASASARQATIQPGESIGHGVRVVSDSAVVRNYATPTNGQWYLEVLRRTWNGQGVAAQTSFVSVAGSSTGSSADPTAPPTTFPTLNQQPGVIEDQPLAWVWVSGASAHTVMFDARLMYTNGGELKLSSVWVLQAYHTLGVFRTGASVLVNQFSTAGGTVRDGRWRYLSSSGNWHPAERIAVSVFAALTDLAALTLPNVGFRTGVTEFYNESTGGIYRWTGTGWLLWTMPLTAFTPTTTNWTQGNGTKVGYYWVESGVYHCKVRLNWGSTSAITGGITIAGPAGAIDTAAGMSGSCIMRDDSAAGYLPMGLAVASGPAGTVRPIPLLSFTGTNGGLNSGNPPIPFAVNDTLEMEWSYVAA